MLSLFVDKILKKNHSICEIDKLKYLDFLIISIFNKYSRHSKN